MFSPFARDILKPTVSERMDYLMKPILPVIDDPWIDDYYKFNTFTHKLRDIATGKRNRAFQLYLNANQYQPKDLNITITDDLIVVHGKHDIKADSRGYVTREFTRRCKVPEYVDATALRAVFKKNGLLIIKARKDVGESPSNGEEFIPIEIQKSAMVEKRKEPETVDESAGHVVGKDKEPAQESVSNVVIKKETL